MMLHDYVASLNILISYLEIEIHKPLWDWHLIPYSSHASPAISLLLLGCHSKLSNVYITNIYYRTLSPLSQYN
jgi:hypothetical protein